MFVNRIPQARDRLSVLFSCRQFSIDRVITPRTAEFYHEEAKKRFFFYVLDTRGQLFLEETPRRNIATCMKDPAFLNFTFSHLRPNTTPHYPDIPLISKCGREINFISPLDRHSVVGFKDIIKKNSATANAADAENTQYELIYASTLSQPFNPMHLKYSPESGRLYHLLTDHKYCKNMYGLLHPHICQNYAKNIVEIGQHEFTFDWLGKTYELKCMETLEEEGEYTAS